MNFASNFAIDSRKSLSARDEAVTGDLELEKALMIVKNKYDENRVARLMAVDSIVRL